MEMKHGMPVWAPTEEEMTQINRRVSKERAAVAQTIFAAVRAWIVRDAEPQIVIRPAALKAPSYY